MDGSNEIIKQEFEEKFKCIEETDKKTKKFRTSLLYASSVIVFIAVLCGTILSYQNYAKAKAKQDRINASQNIVELKKEN